MFTRETGCRREECPKAKQGFKDGGFPACSLFDSLAFGLWPLAFGLWPLALLFLSVLLPPGVGRFGKLVPVTVEIIQLVVKLTGAPADDGASVLQRFVIIGFG